MRIVRYTGSLQGEICGADVLKNGAYLSSEQEGSRKFKNRKSS